MITFISDDNKLNSYTLPSMATWIQLVDWFHNSTVKSTSPMFNKLLEQSCIEGEMNIVMLKDELNRIRTLIPSSVIGYFSGLLLCVDLAKHKVVIT